jgi:hypothetical protein
MFSSHVISSYDLGDKRYSMEERDNDNRNMTKNNPFQKSNTNLNTHIQTSIDGIITSSPNHILPSFSNTKSTVANNISNINKASNTKSVTTEIIDISFSPDVVINGTALTNNKVE